MKKTLAILLAGILFLPLLTKAQGQTKESIYFKSDASILTDSVKERLAIIGKSILLSPTQMVTLSGFTDEDGSDEYNMNLSKKRAEAVYDYLLLKGIAKEKMDIKYFGKSKVDTTKNKGADKQFNRRVEIAFSGQIILGTPRMVGKSQFHTIQASRDNTFKSREGTKVSIPKNSFKTKDGKVYTGPVEIEVAEFYKKADIIKKQLSTTSDRQLLESGGMVYVNLSDGNKNDLVFDSSATMTVQFSGAKKSGMEIFVGDSVDGKLNWVKYKPRDYDWFCGNGGPRRPSTNMNKLNDYAFKGGILGWINCDRFIEVKQKTGLYVNIDDTANVNICLIFKKINSMMDYGDRNNGCDFTFYNVPVGEEVTLLAFSMRGDKVYCSIKELKIGLQGRENLTLTEMSKVDFEKRIRVFNSLKT